MLLKQFVAACMLLCFIVQTFSNLVIVADYYINTGSFAVNCENKDKPQLHCNGQCQMSKQLEKETKKDQHNPDRKAEHKVEITIAKDVFDNFLSQPAGTPRNYLPYTAGKPVHRPASIFHPPCLV